MADHANLIIQKCDGNLQAINIISGLLGTKTRTSTEWEKLLNRFDSELKNNPDLGVTIAAAKLSYDDLPSHMKYLVQYLSVFPRGYNVMLRRLAKAWLAETCRRNGIGDNTEEVEDIIDALVMRGIVHPSKRTEITSGRINGWHVDDVFRQLSSLESKSRGFIDILDEHMVNNNLAISQIRHSNSRCSRILTVSNDLSFTGGRCLATIFGVAMHIGDPAIHRVGGWMPELALP